MDLEYLGIIKVMWETVCICILTKLDFWVAIPRDLRGIPSWKKTENFNQATLRALCSIQCMLNWRVVSENYLLFFYSYMPRAASKPTLNCLTFQRNLAWSRLHTAERTALRGPVISAACAPLTWYLLCSSRWTPRWSPGTSPLWRQ